MLDDLLRGLSQIFCTDKLYAFLLDRDGKALSCVRSVSGRIPDLDGREKDVADFVRNTVRRAGADTLHALPGPLSVMFGDCSRLDYIPVLNVNRPVGGLVIADCADKPSDRELDLISFFLNRFAEHLPDAIHPETPYSDECREDSAQTSRKRTMYMVHQLKSPLAAVYQLLTVLAEGIVGELNEKQSELIQRSQKRVRTQLDMLSDWLMGENASLGLVEERVRTMKIGTVIDQALDTVRPRMELQDVRVTLDELDPDSMVRADPELLTNAIRHVISDAIRFSPAGGLVVLASQRDDEGIRICVRDQGPGVASGDVASIFEDAFRSDDPSSKPTEGAKRNLSLCRKVLEAHGGRINVRNRREGGFETEMFLPAV